MARNQLECNRFCIHIHQARSTNRASHEPDRREIHKYGDKYREEADKLGEIFLFKCIETVIETERIRGEKNIIIHGVSEGEGPLDENVMNDCNYAACLLQTLGRKNTPVSITRTGRHVEICDNKYTEEGNKKCRPIKLIMKSSDEKDLIMSRLSNLKNAEEKYRRISVKDEYTLEERNLVKHWLKIADEKNNAEVTTKYKKEVPQKTVFAWSRSRKDHNSYRNTTEKLL